jgi:CheY-like chemotaxis protein
MIFDDEPDVLQLYSIILKKKGYEVYTEQSCVHLFDKIAAAKPDVIIMDNEMPVVTGLSATRNLKKDKDYEHIPVISISANADGRKLAEDAHADLFLPKPLHIHDLEKAILKVTSQAKAA